MNPPYFIGIDIGTQGARVVLMDARGNIVHHGEEGFPLSDESREEQSPSLWWEACRRILRSVIADARRDISVNELRAISVTSTSGTMIPLSKDMRPLHPAIMYSDPRSVEEGKYCREMAHRFHNRGYTGFNSSSGLSKILWYMRNFPNETARIGKWIHASDFIIGNLTGRWGVTDYTNVLKTGYDLGEKCWPSYLFENLLLKREWLPDVVPSGTHIGDLSPHLAAEFGLPEKIQVVAGMTDGCASQIASGAVKVGDWNTTIGTTLVIKGVTTREIHDPLDRLYNHRHPDGYWMPGGASNIGADWVTREFGERLDALNTEAKDLLPTGHMAYPLRQEGERFPFISPAARGFQPSGLSEAQLFTANMEGVAYIERFAFSLIESLSGERVKAVYAAGGGSKSDTWLTIRSNVMNLPIYKMKNVSGAVGAAVLAASGTHFKSIVDAVESMSQIEKQIFPQKSLAAEYEKDYRGFIALMQEKGFIQKEELHA